jgi:hypothetical protein
LVHKPIHVKEFDSASIHTPPPGPVASLSPSYMYIFIYLQQKSAFPETPNIQLDKLTKSMGHSYGVDAYIYFHNQKIVSSRICHTFISR